MKLRNAFLACAALALCAQSALAVVTTGPGGRGVRVGSSSLISTLDYSDTFTGTDNGGAPNRPYVAAVQAAPTYVIESAYGGAPVVNWQTVGQPPGVGEFSIASDTAGLVNGSPTYPGSSGSGSDLGITQTGRGIDFGIPYGLGRTRYLVQADAVAFSDRIDITSGGIPGTIFQPNSLSVFFRGDGTGNASLYNGTTDTPLNINTGLTNDGQWHNYAVLFDQQAKTVQIFVDEQSKALVNLTTFAGGIYANFSSAAVGVGGGAGAGQNRLWTDNFQVGEPVAVPEPATVALFGLGALGLFWMRRRSK
jgi:hypothetical protein